ADKAWFEHLSELIKQEGYQNIDLRYEWHGHLMASYDPVEIDLLYVDGGPRRECLINGFPRVKDGGYVYCDNTDSSFWGEGGFTQLVRELGVGYEAIEYFTDFAPATFSVSEGALIRKNCTA